MGASDAPAMVDYLPQSIIGDMSWTIYKILHDIGREHDGRLTTAVHDSFLFQCPEHWVECLIPDVLKVMEQEFPEVAPGFHIPATVKVGAPGASWGELEKV